MQIILNGEKREFPTALTVAGLVAALQADPRTVAVERNREIVPKSQHAAVALAEGDEIEIIGFIGGG